VSPEEITARLASLREAGQKLRQRPAASTHDALARVLDGWSDPGSRWRAELERTLPDAAGFSPETVREGLARALHDWNGAALKRLVAQELSDPETLGFDTTSVLLAGSIPMPTLLALIAPLALRSPVLAKCASRDPVTAPLVAQSIAETDALLGACIDVVDVPGSDAACTQALLAADCVMATGSDETIAAVAARVSPPRRLVARGHKLSVAALGPAATQGDALAAAAEALALDVALWDQQGCLSPIAIYVCGDDAEAPDRVAAALAAALEAAEQRWPRGRVDASDAARFEHERAEAELRQASGRRVAVWSDPRKRFAVVREQDAAPRPAPLHRFVRVLPVHDADALLRAVLPLSKHLAAVAIAGFAADPAGLASALLRRGASRTCAPGELQAPPLDWRNEGRGVLQPLALEPGCKE